MVYEVISPRGRGTGNIVGVHTESPQCIDSLDMQKAMVAGGSMVRNSHILTTKNAAYLADRRHGLNRS